MPLTPGTRLGYYEITAPLGAGGMGEVYKARDTRLGREVAIKALPDAFANSDDALARFQREAQILGSLNHPNIAAIYELEEHNGARYLVLEYVPGETLAERLRGGPLSVEESLEIASRVAEGLEVAHEKSVVHRDLKPANIKITPDGKVKVLDFGLAKDVAADRSGVQDALNSPTLTAASPAYTRAGVILGTAAYMSPEQARGKPVDKRADIWAFGCILFECLTGKMAFGGETVTDILAAVVKSEPQWRALPDEAGPRVHELLGRCLQKDPRSRLRDIGDARILISEAQSGDSTVVASAAPRPVRRLLPIPVAACLTALVLGLIAGMWWKGRSEPAAVWTGAYLGGNEISTFPRPSPDGHLLAFVAKDNDDVMQVWVMKPESGNRVMLTHRRDLGYASICSWSPDGNRIFYDRYSDQLKGVFSVPALGGDEQMVLETGGSPEALPDGSLLVGQINPERQQQLYRYWPDSGKSQALPVILPNGILYGTATIRAFSDGRRAIVFGIAAGERTEATGPHLYVVDLETGKLHMLNADYGDLVANGGVPPATVTADGKTAIFGSSQGPLSRVMSVPIDGHAPAQQLFTLTGGYLQSLAVGVDGDIYLDQGDRPMDIVRFAPEGGHVERIAAVQKPVGDYFAALPDGRAVWIEYAAGRRRLMIGALGKEPASFVNTTEEISGPLTAVGPDTVAFVVGVKTHPAIVVAALSNGRIVRRIPFDKGLIEQMASSPDGKTLYWAAAGSIWAVTADGEARRQHPGNYVSVEPGGQSLLIVVREPPNTKLVRVPLNGGLEQEMPVTRPLTLGFEIDNEGVRNGRLVAPGSGPTWYWPPAIFDLATGKSARIPLDYLSDFHHMSWTPDGKVMACALVWRSNMWKFTRRLH